MNTSRFLTDDQLFAQCRMDTYRGSGPGGQKRNKTSNAVRLVHKPTGLFVTATESRSLALNKLHAVRRLRLKLVCEVREPVDLASFEPPDWVVSVRLERRFVVSTKNVLYMPLVGLVLDLFQATGANPAAVGVNLRVSTSAVLKLLASDPHIWTTANHLRAAAGLEPLSNR